MDNQNPTPPDPSRDRKGAGSPHQSRGRKPADTPFGLNGPKRIFDICGATILLIVLSPLLLLVAVLVKLTSRGPMFFTQDRAGHLGRIFRVVKFRTMRASRVHDPTELVPLSHPDITSIGFFLRRFKLDEVPQLWNVLNGEMSLVGPRPALPGQAAAYDDFQRQRLLVPPGVTGLAQVYGSSMMSWEQRILYDVAYVQRRGFLLDLRILLRSLWVIMAGEHRSMRPFAESPFAQSLHTDSRP